MKRVTLFVFISISILTYAQYPELKSSWIIIGEDCTDYFGVKKTA